MNLDKYNHEILNDVAERLEGCRQIIEGEMDCSTPEYSALRSLHNIVGYLAVVVTRFSDANDEYARSRSEGLDDK